VPASVRLSVNVAVCNCTDTIARSAQRDREPFAPKAGRLLERVGNLQDAEIVAVPAHDLDADGQTFGTEPGEGLKGCERTTERLAEDHGYR